MEVFSWFPIFIIDASKEYIVLKLEKTVQTDPLRIVQIDPRFFIKFLPAA